MKFNRRKVLRGVAAAGALLALPAVASAAVPPDFVPTVSATITGPNSLAFMLHTALRKKGLKIMPPGDTKGIDVPYVCYIANGCERSSPNYHDYYNEPVVDALARGLALSLEENQRPIRFSSRPINGLKAGKTVMHVHQWVYVFESEVFDPEHNAMRVSCEFWAM